MVRTLLETRRLRLREATMDDFDDVYRMESDPEVMRYVGDGHPRPFEAVKLEKNIRYYRDHPGLGIWIVQLKDGTFVGSACLKRLEKTEEVELGFCLLKEHWGRGFATEVGKALVEYGFEQLGLPQIVATAHPKNRASIHVIEKCGLAFDRTGEWDGMKSNRYSVNRGQYSRQRKTPGSRQAGEMEKKRE